METCKCWNKFFYAGFSQCTKCMKESLEDKALRYNEWKPEWTLVDFDSLESMVRVLEFGSKKYTKHLISFEELLSYFQLWKNPESVIIVTKKNPSVQNDYVLSAIETLHLRLPRVLVVERWDNFGPKICADHALSKRESHVTQVNYLQSNYTNATTTESLKILRSIATDTTKEKNPHDSSSPESVRSSYGDLKDIEWLRIFTSKDVSLVAEYADQLKGYTLIMTMIQDCIETYYVVNATKDSDCLMTLLKLWQRLWIISRDISIPVVTWRDNWKKPMDRKKILDSLMRHLVRLMADEEIDSESKLPHIGHILANCMMYSYHSKNK